jgi:DNA-binding Lrp family transcriptional regulator
MWLKQYLFVETLYILVNCDLGSEVDIIKELEKISEVKEVRGTYGIYDIFVKLQADSGQALESLITHKIRRLPKVRSTVTLTPILSQGGR